VIDIISFRTEGLGDSTYLVLYAGSAIVVDAQRDIDRFLDRLDHHQPRWVLETHLHNDYVSGGLSLARRTGAELVLPAAAAPAFRHTPAFHGEDLVDDDVTIRPLHTPGHTPEHTSYVLIVEGEEKAVFSGGSLLVGSAGRSDLLGPDRADSLARLQYGSVNRLARLPDRTGLYPTHGAGSFCTAAAAGDSTSTIGEEKRTNPVLSHPDEDAFVASHLSGLEPYPDYYARMAPINLAGPPALGDVSPPQLTLDDLEEGTPVVDTRTADDFAAGHLPGALNIPLSDQFGTWFGWLLDPDVRPVLVTTDSGASTEAVTQLARLGIDGLPGVVEGSRAGTVQTHTGRISDLSPDDQILDVRSPEERSQTAPDGTVHRYLPDLRQGPPAGIDTGSPVWVVCATGFRSAIAASMLQAQGIAAIPVLDGGVDDL
jgi:hydroxyacylglutathione hydrolase